MRMMTLSQRFVVPVQAKRFETKLSEEQQNEA